MLGRAGIVRRRNIDPRTLHEYKKVPRPWRKSGRAGQFIETAAGGLCPAAFVGSQTNSFKL
jgi:hypothetical protein